MVVTPRLANVVVWVVFVVAHLALFVASLIALWWFQASPLAIQASAVRFVHSSPTSAIIGTTAFLGITGGGVLWAYAKAWRWLLHKMLSAFLFSP